jgi:hypothetical protein
MTGKPAKAMVGKAAMALKASRKPRKLARVGTGLEALPALPHDINPIRIRL